MWCFAGSNNEGVQVLVNSINSMLGNYGSTIDLEGHTQLAAKVMMPPLHNW